MKFEMTFLQMSVWPNELASDRMIETDVHHQMISCWGMQQYHQQKSYKGTGMKRYHLYNNPHCQ